MPSAQANGKNADLQREGGLAPRFILEGFGISPIFQETAFDSDRTIRVETVLAIITSLLFLHCRVHLARMIGLFIGFVQRFRTILQ